MNNIFYVLYNIYITQKNLVKNLTVKNSRLSQFNKYV